MQISLDGKVFKFRSVNIQEGGRWNLYLRFISRIFFFGSCRRNSDLEIHVEYLLR